MRAFSLRSSLDRHPEIPAPPVSVRDLAERFGTGGSTAALLRRMGPFLAATDAFRFPNDFQITLEQVDDFVDLLTEEIVEAEIQRVVGMYVGVLRDIDLNPIPKLEKRIPEAAIDFVVGRLIRELSARIIDLAADPQGSDYGRCGGMAFAGYDFYVAGRPVDASVTQPPTEGPLGEYIYERLLDSLRLNIGTFLRWVVDVHVLPELDEFATATLLAAAGSVVGGPVGTLIGAFIGSRIDIFDLGGPETVLDDTKRSWSRLKDLLDQQAAWPVGLILGDKFHLWEQHQVLAVGYSDDGAGGGALRIWDNEDANVDKTTTLDFRGDELEATGRHPNLKGFFPEQYSFQNPPDGL
jgi:hypothetical protein